MLRRSLALSAVLGFCGSANAQLLPPPSSAQPSTPIGNALVTPAPSGPKIKFAEPVYDFGRMPSGDVLKHEYVFTNVGIDKLTISNVQPSCGCTPAGEWTREVPPGGTGKIPIQFNTANISGPIAKTVTVVCNDRDQNVHYLQLKGTLWKPLEISPPYAILNVTPDSGGASVKLNITNNMESAVEVWDPKITNPGFSVELTTNTPGRSFTLAVSVSTPDKPGGLQGNITFKSTVTNVPMITAWANVQPAISLVPASLTLPPAPLAGRSSPVVTIINNLTNGLTLTDPAVNAPGVDVQIRELQPGKYYTAMINFPQGFEAPAGKPLEFTVKTSNPKHPTLTVPITQPPKPATSQATPPSAPSLGQVSPTPATATPMAATPTRTVRPKVQGPPPGMMLPPLPTAPSAQVTK